MLRPLTIAPLLATLAAIQVASPQPVLAQGTESTSEERLPTEVKQRIEQLEKLRDAVRPPIQKEFRLSWLLDALLPGVGTLYVTEDLGQAAVFLLTIAVADWMSVTSLGPLVAKQQPRLNLTPEQMLTIGAGGAVFVHLFGSSIQSGKNVSYLSSINGRNDSVRLKYQAEIGAIYATENALKKAKIAADAGHFDEALEAIASSDATLEPRLVTAKASILKRKQQSDEQQDAKTIEQATALWAAGSRSEAVSLLKQAPSSERLGPQITTTLEAWQGILQRQAEQRAAAAEALKRKQEAQAESRLRQKYLSEYPLKAAELTEAWELLVTRIAENNELRIRINLIAQNVTYINSPKIKEIEKIYAIKIDHTNNKLTPAYKSWQLKLIEFRERYGPSALENLRDEKALPIIHMPD